MWAGASVNFEYLVYGVVLMTFGFTFGQAAFLILVGNISYLLLGVCSLQGPDAGTTTFMISRAPFGPNGNRPIALFNWLTQVGFETEGLILVVFGGLALAVKAGYHPGTPLKVVLIVAAAAIQGVLPFLGYATVVKVLRALIIPFVILYVILAILTVGKVDAGSVHHGANWQTMMGGLAFTITLSGLGWVESGNDFSRYLPRTASRRSIIGWVFVATAIPQVLLMLLGAAVATYVEIDSKDPFSSFPHAFSSWFLVPFLVVAIVQLFAINSMDVYSSGVTLQALGVPVKRWNAVLIDTVIGCGITAYAVFSAGFSRLLSDFVAAVIAWIGPWMAIFLVDWLLRRQRYVPVRAPADRRRRPVLAARWRSLAGSGGAGPGLVGVHPGIQPELLRRTDRPRLWRGRRRLQRVHGDPGRWPLLPDPGPAGGSPEAEVQANCSPSSSLPQPLW